MADGVATAEVVLLRILNSDKWLNNGSESPKTTLKEKTRRKAMSLLRTKAANGASARRDPGGLRTELFS